MKFKVIMFSARVVEFDAKDEETVGEMAEQHRRGVGTEKSFRLVTETEYAARIVGPDYDHELALDDVGEMIMAIA